MPSTNNYKTMTYECLLEKASQNDSEAQYELYKRLDSKQGISDSALHWLKEKGDNSPIYWLTKSAENGLADAQYQLGLYYFRNKSFDVSFYWLNKAKKQNFNGDFSYIEKINSVENDNNEDLNQQFFSNRSQLTH